MNKDIRLSTTFFTHRKTKKLKRLHGDHGVICLLNLWTRVAIEKPSGILEGWDETDIEIESDYSGDGGAFVEALITIGFLDFDGCYKLHNWEERQAWVVNTQDRSDRARLLRMAKTHNKIYKRLVNDGYTGIERCEYNKLTKVQRAVNVSLTAPLTPVPVPVPDPVPAPKTKNTKSVKKFTQPTKKEIADYCQERGNNVDPEGWLDHYTSNGWMVGKNKMRDWKAAVRTWERNSNQFGNQGEVSEWA